MTEIEGKAEDERESTIENEILDHKITLLEKNMMKDQQKKTKDDDE